MPSPFPGMDPYLELPELWPVEEAFLEIRRIASKKLVTIIEVLSPSNKIRGSSGRASFLSKRKEALRSGVNWVEIDLLRAGRPSLPLAATKNSDYRILVYRGDNATEARCWPVSVRQPLPVIAVPLREPDADVPLDLGTVLRDCYEHAAYDLSVDYRKKPDPPLIGGSSSWAAGLLRSQCLR